MASFVCGLHTDEQYSIVGRTEVLFAAVFVSWLLTFRFLLKNIRSIKDTIILQDDLNKLADWEQKWGMDFHPDKCSTLHVTRSRTPILQDYILKGHKLTIFL
jgi:hypothetical protein